MSWRKRTKSLSTPERESLGHAGGVLCSRVAHHPARPRGAKSGVRCRCSATLHSRQLTQRAPLPHKGCAFLFRLAKHKRQRLQRRNGRTPITPKRNSPTRKHSGKIATCSAPPPALRCASEKDTLSHQSAGGSTQAHEGTARKHAGRMESRSPLACATPATDTRAPSRLDKITFAPTPSLPAHFRLKRQTPTSRRPLRRASGSIIPQRLRTPPRAPRFTLYAAWLHALCVAISL